MTHLAPDLRHLVSLSTALLGDVIAHELGLPMFKRIEGIRRQMALLRGRPDEESFAILSALTKDFRDLAPDQRRAIGLSFALMLELMNACENAYRSFRLSAAANAPPPDAAKPDAIIYVLTAHPTEARDPRNIRVFQEIQDVLRDWLRRGEPEEEQRLALKHLLETAWKTSLVRPRTPTVTDEAEHVYTMLLREEILRECLEFAGSRVPFYVRSWVGGDKDGHPGVDHKVMLDSLTLSRQKLIALSTRFLHDVRETLELFPSARLRRQLAIVERKRRALSDLRAGDVSRLRAFREALGTLNDSYEEDVGTLHPALRAHRRLLHLFPALVVPLELRESSDVLLTKSVRPLAIDRMLDTLAKISRGGDPRWYARGFIVSMTSSVEHLKAAAERQTRAFGAPRLPVIPLFEENASLDASERIMRDVLNDKVLKRAIKDHWDGLAEMMVGYSDSAKEAGVVPSRLAIARALPRLEKACLDAGVTPVFFHGSGGSVDRGGGSIEDQIAWWPRSALRRYKVTVQGEMVERSLATAPIARRQLEHILESASHGLMEPPPQPESELLHRFADRISKHYRATIASENFLELVEKATPYSYLSALKIGSRPAKRASKIDVGGLRAIPWVLCWTQTRVLFPTWWGVGSAWTESSPTEKDQLRHAFANEPVFTSAVKALGFTLAKVELAVWRLALAESGLPAETAERAFKTFKDEFRKAGVFLKEITGEDDPLWFRPWLGESIQLRSPMIHPLNALQIIAAQTKDLFLLRLTVTGISSGMLTTG